MLNKLISFCLKTLCVSFICAFALSCQDDFLEIGGNLVDNVNFSTDSITISVKAYNKSFINQGVQTSGISTGTGALGVYDDPVYGQTVASMLSQISINTTSPSFGSNPVVDSVVLSIPYYSTATGTTEDGGNEYRLDSVYGDSPIKLMAFRSNYFLSANSAGDVSKSAVYYSNQLSSFNGLEGDTLSLLKNDLVDPDSFVPSKKK